MVDYVKKYKIEFNDAVALIGYYVIGLTAIVQFTTQAVTPIVMDTLLDLVKSIFTTSSGNLWALGLAILLLGIEKYMRYGK